MADQEEAALRDGRVGAAHSHGHLHAQHRVLSDAAPLAGVRDAFQRRAVVTPDYFHPQRAAARYPLRLVLLQEEKASLTPKARTINAPPTALTNPVRSQ